MFPAPGLELPAEQRRASTPNITGWSQIIPQQDVSPSSSESDAHELLEFEMLMAQQIQDSSIAQSQLWPSLGSGYPGMAGTIPLSSFPSAIPDRCLEELPLSVQHDTVLQTLHAAFPEAGSSAPNFGAVDVSVQAHDVTRQPLRDQPSGGPLHTHNLSPPADRKHSRSRTHHACQPCRQRKAKCNGTVPCNRCQSRDTECVYSAERKVRGPNKVKHRPSPLVLVDSLIKKQRRGRAPVRSRSRSNEPLEPQSSASSTFSLPNEPPLSAGSSMFTSSTDPPPSTGSSSSQEASALFGPESYETLLSFLPLEDGKLDGMSIHTPQSLPPRLLPPGTYSHMSFRGSDELGPPQFDLMGNQASPESDFLDLLSSSSEPSSAEPSYPSSPMLEPTSSFAIDPILEALSAMPAIEHSTPRKAGRHRGMSDSMLLSSSFSAVTLKADELIDTTNAHTATGQSLDLV